MNLQFKKSPDERGKGRVNPASRLLIRTIIYGLDIYSLNWVSKEIEKEVLKRCK